MIEKDFTGSDIRGKDFTCINLSRCNFSMVRSGLHNSSWVFHICGFLIILCLFIGLLMFAATYEAMLLSPEVYNSMFDAMRQAILDDPAAYGLQPGSPLPEFVAVPETSNGYTTFLGLYLLAILVIFFLLFLSTKWLIAVVFSAIAALAIGSIQTYYFDILNTTLQSQLGTFAIIIHNGTLLFTFLLATLVCYCLCLAGKLKDKAIFILSAIFVALLLFIGSLSLFPFLTIPEPSFPLEPSFLSVVSSLSLLAISILFGSIIGWQAFNGAKKFSYIRRFAFLVANLGGTSFKQSNLSEVDFTNAYLKTADFQGALLDYVCWRGAKSLHQARIKSTFLDQPKVIDLVTKGDGRGEDLSGLNLKNTNLRDFDLYDATLVGTQLQGADLRGANITGACIDNWEIDRHTELSQVKCDYIYMSHQNGQRLNKVPTGDSNFSPDGHEFSQFARALIDTLDITHKLSDSVNPETILRTLKDISKEYREPLLEIIAAENREKLIRLRVRTSGKNTNKFLEDKYAEKYSRYINHDSLSSYKWQPQENLALKAFSTILDHVKQGPDAGVYLNFETRNYNINNSKINCLNIVEGNIVVTSDKKLGGQNDQ